MLEQERFELGDLVRLNLVMAVWEPGMAQEVSVAQGSLGVVVDMSRSVMKRRLYAVKWHVQGDLWCIINHFSHEIESA